MLETATKFLGLKRIFFTIPPVTTYLAAIALEPLGRLIKKHPPMTWDLHHAVNRYLFYSSNKAKEELGFNPRSFEEIVKQYFLGKY